MNKTASKQLAENFPYMADKDGCLMIYDEEKNVWNRARLKDKPRFYYYDDKTDTWKLWEDE